jgi:O-antigen ligase
MAQFILILVLVSLTGNRLPWLNVLAMILFVPLHLLSDSNNVADPELVPRGTVRWVKIAYAFWLVSYLLTQAPLSNLFSFDFLRRDGALLFAYLPLLVLRNYGLKRAFLERAVRMYLSIMAVLALIGGILYLEALGNISLSSWLLPEDLQIIANSPLAGYEFHGFFEAHNAAGAVYGLACCLSLALLVFCGRLRFFSLPTCWFAATFIGLMLSKSRSAYVAFAAASLTLLLGKEKDRGKVLKLALVLIAPLMYFILVQPEVSQRAGAVASTDDPNVAERLIYFQRAIDDFLSSPLIGIGFGRYNDEYLSFSGIQNFAYVATRGEIVNESNHAHNSYLHFLAEGGLVGLGLMMAIWISAYRWARRMQDYFPMNTFSYAFDVGVQACIIFEFFDSFTEHSMGTAVTSLTIFTMFGILRNFAGSVRTREAVSVPIDLLSDRAPA